MTQIIVFIIPLLLVVFWLWMFWEMTNNDALPPCFISLSNGRNVRNDWVAAFIILNVFTAGYYFFTEYRQ